MSTVVPRKPLERIQYFENHVGPWTTNAVAIGSSAPEVSSFATKTQAARDAYIAQQTAIQAAVAATQAYHDAFDDMSTAGGAIMKQIRAKAESTGNPAVYTLAEIPAPKTPTPLGPPGTPFDFKVVLLPNGSLDLAWKCQNPGGGVIYHVSRRDEPTAPFTFLGGSPQRMFLDATVPAGASQLTYKVQGVRASGVGVAQEFNVNLGTTNGVMTATVTVGSTTPKLAA